MPAQPPLSSRITAANAREMAARSRDARIKRRQAELQRLALVDQLLAKAAEAPTPQPAQAPAPTNDFQARRLSRVRAQIDRLSDLLDSCDDPVKLDRLASAIERLSDLERTLDGRPLPGNLRPVAARSSNAARSTSALPSPIATPLPSSSSAASLAPSPIDPQRIP